VPRVSVNIPAYNAEAFLSRALRSVEVQTYGDYEIVLVDDGSTDSTAEIARSFERVRYVHQAHKGESAARSRGLEESEGDLVAFLDADDEWLPEKLERQLAFMDERRSEFSYTDSYCTKGGKRVRYSKLAPPYDGQILVPLLEEWLEHAFITNNSVVASKELLRRVGGFDYEAPFPSNTDYGLWLRVALAGARFDYLDQPLAIYYRGHQSDSSDSIVMLKRYMQALEYFSLRYPFPPEAQALLERTLERTNVALGAKLLKHGRLREAAPYLRHGHLRDLAAKSRLFFRRRLRTIFRRSG
jgi:glycosyltransferase involved in cell wall biosynthesis